MLMKRVLSIQETQVGPDMLLHKLGIIDEIESLYWS